MFDDVTSNLACALLMRWSSFDSLRAASEQELREFYRAAACWHADTVEKRLAAWRAAQSLTGDQAIVESGQLQSGVLVRQIVELNRAIGDYEARIAQLMEQHDDGTLFQSFPGAGAALAPRLLAAFGTDRDRLDDAQQMQQHAGVAPVTKRSGKSHRVVRRRACKTFLLQTFHEFAGQSIKQSLWAKAYYQMMRERGSQHQAAVRALAFKWIRILHHCWKSRQCYDEPTYLAALKQRSSPINNYLYPTCQETQP